MTCFSSWHKNCIWTWKYDKLALPELFTMCLCNVSLQRFMLSERVKNFFFASLQKSAARIQKPLKCYIKHHKCLQLTTNLCNHQLFCCLKYYRWHVIPKVDIRPNKTVWHHIILKLLNWISFAALIQLIQVSPDVHQLLFFICNQFCVFTGT